MLHGEKRQFRVTKSIHACLAFEKKNCFKFKAVSMDTASLLCDSEGRKHVACVRFSLEHVLMPTIIYILCDYKHPVNHTS